MWVFQLSQSLENFWKFIVGNGTSLFITLLTALQFADLDWSAEAPALSHQLNHLHEMPRILRKVLLCVLAYITTRKYWNFTSTKAKVPLPNRGQQISTWPKSFWFPTRIRIQIGLWIRTLLVYKCAADFSLLNLPKGKSLGRSKPATNS